MHSAVGGITESDIILANSSGGLVIGFNVRANPQAREMANRDHVDIRYYSIIYNVIDDMKQLMEGLLAPEIRERQIGYAEVRDVFSVSRAGKAAGCMVTEGLFKRGNKVRLLRDDVVIFEGSLKSLRRFKDDVREVQQGYECGMAFENYDDIKEGDVIECFEAEEITRSSNERAQKARNKTWHDIRNQVFVNFVLARNCGMPLPKSWVAENYATRTPRARYHRYGSTGKPRSQACDGFRDATWRRV